MTTLMNFDGANGSYPGAPLIQGTDGNFYGTTAKGGANGYGTVFKITPAGTLTTLHSFDGTDGYEPLAGLVQASDGNFYGTTYQGGTDGAGTVFKITPTGTLTTLHSFDGTDGNGPEAGLVQANDGNFYGTTYYGGNGGCQLPGCGTVFKITSGGALTTLHSFAGADGAAPLAGLVQAADGNFYATTVYGGTYNDGTVFKITSGGALTTLYSFCAQTGCNGTYPSAGLVQATDGNFYGTAFYGGTYNDGTVFKITSEGTLTTLYSLGGGAGANPWAAALVQATDGSFYGTALNGGTYGDGVVFKITSSGTLTTLHSFNSSDGANPQGGLVQATDGNFYGTTFFGGANDNCAAPPNGCGTVFRLAVGLVLSDVQFVPATPCRLVDTRQIHDPIQGGTWQDFIVPQLGDCNIPATAAAYSLNVTVVPQGPLGYLTIWPAGKNQPTVSTMNSVDGRIKANAAIVPAGASGAVSVYATNTTDLILDVDGYFAPPASGTYQFYPLTPCRLVDTRGADGSLGGPRLPAQTPRSFPLLSSSCIPKGLNPLAYSLNFTVVPNPSGQPLGYLSVWPAGESQPVVSTLNNPTATVVANAAIVPAGTGGAIDVSAYNTTDLLIDINGYFATPGTGGLSLYPVAPCRVLDTRQSGGSFVGEKTVNVVGSACAPPSNTAAYIFNATVVPPGSMPFLTLWPNGEPQPTVSTLNAYDGFITSNMAIVPTNNGSIDAYAAGLTQLLLDISGYFAP
ncbi:MAG: choice-of-anchor tandem repeat GloVer-containing protein [Candidatus Korobacteraceae bacterium]